MAGKTVVIFYSSIGYGHISAARAIQDEIQRESPDTRILLQDIRAFMHPVWRRVDERLYWFVAGHLPESFDHLFHSMQARGNQVAALSSLPNDYPEAKVLDYLTAQMPDAVLATHYGAAQVLGTLRQQGRLSGVRIGWLHTDFFEGYFPRISQRIDRTFLAHPELEARWLAAGVPADKLVTSGMPVQVVPAAPDQRERTLAGLGLAPDVPTLLLTGGKEGAGDYRAVIEGIVHDWPQAVQVIAVCGTNARQKAALAELQATLPGRVRLEVLGLVPRGDMGNFMRAADVLLTKAGGMTPAEAFVTGVPTVLLDVIAGHERENAALFVRQGLAELAATPGEAGVRVARLLSDAGRRAGMLQAQREFRERTDIASIARFALDDSFVPAQPLPDYGVEEGTPALGADAALAQLDAQAPAELELLLSYATSRTPQRVVLENPFGHLAIRIDSTVYSANYIAEPGVDHSLLQHLSLADYLYGTDRPSHSQVHTNTYGMAYGRETLGLRVRGVTPERRAAMVAEAQRIDDEFREGRLRWHRSEFNCADVVARILAAGAYACPTWIDRARLPRMPLDLFERLRARLETDASLDDELVAYRLLTGTRASYRFSRFPLSLGQPLRSMARALGNESGDPLEQAVTKQVTGYFGDRRLYVEDLRTADAASGLEQALLADLRRLLAVYARLPLGAIERLRGLAAAQQFQRLVDRGLELARMATEHAEDEGANPPLALRLRTVLGQLVEDYGHVRPQRLEARHVRAYLARLQVFESALGREARPARDRDSWVGRHAATLVAAWRRTMAHLRHMMRLRPGG